MVYHRQKKSKLWIHRHGISVHEDELSFMFLFSHQDNIDLLGGDGQDRQLNAVELIEAAPRARLGESLEDPAKSTEVHLIRAVEDDAVFAEGLGHVLRRLCLTGTGRTGGSTTERHSKRLSQCYVTPEKYATTINLSTPEPTWKAAGTPVYAVEHTGRILR